MKLSVTHQKYSYILKRDLQIYNTFTYIYIYSETEKKNSCIKVKSYLNLFYIEYVDFELIEFKNSETCKLKYINSWDDIMKNENRYLYIYMF